VSVKLSKAYLRRGAKNDRRSCRLPVFGQERERAESGPGTRKVPRSTGYQIILVNFSL